MKPGITPEEQAEFDRLAARQDLSEAEERRYLLLSGVPPTTIEEIFAGDDVVIVKNPEP